MTDVHKITPPSGTPEPSGKQRPEEPDPDKFKKQMKVDETDPEQKGKKKEKPRQEEEEEGIPIEQKPLPPPAPFSLEPGEKLQNPFDVDSKTSPLGNAAPSTSSQNLGNDFAPSGPLDENVQEEEITPSVSPAPSEESPFPSQSPSQDSFAIQEPVSPAQNEKTPQETQKSSESQKKEKTSSKKPVYVETSLAKKPSKGQETPPPSPQIPQEQKTESKEKLFEEAAQHKESPLPSKEKTPSQPLQERQALQEQMGTPKITAPSHEAKKEQDDSLLLLPPPTPQTEPFFGQLPQLSEAPPSANLPPHVFEVFEKMVGMLMQITSPETIETIVTLNASQYENSKFFGTKITIIQHKNAPGSFNIKLEGSPDAVKDFTKYSDNLMTAFARGNYTFEVKRIEVSLREEERKGIVRRKKSLNNDEKSA